MSRFYQDNLRALHNRDPLLAQALDELQVPAAYTYVRNKSGHPNICLPALGRQVHYHSTYDPYAESQKFMAAFYRDQQQQCREAAFALLVGFGCGYVLFDLLETLTWLKELIVFEPDASAFKLVMQNQDLTSIFENAKISFIVGDFSLPVLRRLRAAQWLNLGKLVVIPWLQIPMLFPKLKAQFEQVLGEFLLEKQITVNTYISTGNWMLRNRFLNIPYLFAIPPVNELFGACSGWPAFCIAAGPSLNDNLEDLKRVRHAAVFICADTAFKVLMAQGITPDVVTAADPHAAKFKYFEDHPEQTRGVLLVAGTNTYPGLLACWQGPVRIMLQGSELFGFLFEDLAYPDVEKLPDTYTVALNSLVIAEKLGCSPLILVGQDLCLGKTDHAGGTSLNKRVEIEQDGEKYIARTYHLGEPFVDMYGATIHTGQELLAQEVFPVPGYQEQIVYTWSNFIFYLRCFADHISGLSLPVLNLTRTGARISGARQVEFSQISEHFAQPVRFPELVEVGVKPTNQDQALQALRQCTSQCRQLTGLIEQQLVKTMSSSWGSYGEKTEDLAGFLTGLYASDAPLMRLLDLHMPAAVIRHCREQFRQVDFLAAVQADRRRYQSTLRMVLSLRKAVADLLRNVQMSEESILAKRRKTTDK